jgi:hypothetical protein
MLERLDEISWHQLHHAYGLAEDVPELLRALSRSGEEQEEALGKLFGNIWHQGTHRRRPPPCWMRECASQPVPVRLLRPPSPCTKSEVSSTARRCHYTASWRLRHGSQKVF